MLSSVPMERAVFLKEQNSKLYRVATYFIGKMSIELIFTMIYPILYVLIIYWVSAFNSNSAERVILAGMLHILFPKNEKPYFQYYKIIINLFSKLIFFNY